MPHPCSNWPTYVGLFVWYILRLCVMSLVSSRLLWLLDSMSMHTYWCLLVSGQIYLDHCFEFGCMGQWDVVAETYSGGYILFCTERQVSAVIVVFLMSASQVYFVCVWHLLCDGGHVLRIGRHFYIFFQTVDIIFGMWVPCYSSIL